MGEYITVIVGVSICASLLLLLSPFEGIKSHQKLLSGLCIVCVMTAPLSDAIEHIKSLDLESILPSDESQREEIYDSYFEDYTESTVKGVVSTQLKETFGVEAEDLRISFSGEGDEKRISGVYILLPRSAIFKDTAKIEVYFEGLLKCDAVVAIA